MDVAARNRLAELMYEVKEKVPDGTFLEFMNILGKKENEPDFDRVKFVRLKRHLFAYDQKYKKKNRRSIPLEYDTENMVIEIETLLLAVDDDDDLPINFDDKTISRQWLQHELYETYTKTCSCGRCHYRFPSASSGPSYICLLYTSPSPRDQRGSRMPSSA